MSFTNLSQSFVFVASIAMTGISFGITESLYSFDCSSKISRAGIETTLTSIPSDFKISCASMAVLTSEPVAINTNLASFSSLLIT